MTFDGSLFGLCVDLCLVLETKEGPQTPILLEYLPPWNWICHRYPWGDQCFQRPRYLGSGKEMEINLHMRDSCFGCRCSTSGGNHLENSIEEEVE